jgi:hypothetical protein
MNVKTYQLLYAASVATVLLFPATHAIAAPPDLHARTAGELARFCSTDPRSPNSNAEINYCEGYAQGVFTSAGYRHQKLICMPDPSPKRRATMKEFVGWAQATPSRGAEPADEGLLHFMAERYPCK